MTPKMKDSFSFGYLVFNRGIRPSLKQDEQSMRFGYLVFSRGIRPNSRFEIN